MKKFKEYKTTSGRILKINSNETKRHFTIKTDTGFKYRTYPMSKEEFKDNEFNTANDWQCVLNSESYYRL